MSTAMTTRLRLPQTDPRLPALRRQLLAEPGASTDRLQDRVALLSLVATIGIILLLLLGY